jgi:hypothetical protein
MSAHRAGEFVPLVIASQTVGSIAVRDFLV